MDISSLAIIFFVAILASAFGALIGGSSIITIPTLILLGLPPHTAIGTDRFGIIGIGLAGWYKFQKMGLINYRIGFTIAIPVLLGSALGSNLVLQISEGVLKNVIIILNILILIFILLNPDIGVEKKAAPLTNRRIAIGALLSFLVGIYGGFYGALAGTFVLYILILWFQLTFIQGAATLNVDYALGGAMLAGCLIGSYLGSHYAERIGNVWVKRIFTAFIIIAVIKLILSD
jgi:uncharacterized membrane protein YfcA